MMRISIYPDTLNTKGDYNLVYFDELRRINGKLYIGQCYTSVGHRYFKYPFVLRFHGHFCKIPCDLHFALENATCKMISCCHAGYEDFERYFGDLQDSDLIVADFNV